MAIMDEGGLVGVNKECVIVLGMHRSGTSLLSGVVSAFGYDLGIQIMKPTSENPKGYFENDKVYHLNRKILQEQGKDWDSLIFNVDAIDKVKFEGYVREAVDILSSEFAGVARIAIKDPRLCILFPVWERALKKLGYNIRVLWTVRNPLEVARSLNKRNSFSIEKGVILWANHFFYAELFSRNVSRLIVFYPNDYLSLDTVLRGISEFLEVECSQKIFDNVASLYSADLVHHQVDFENIEGLPSDIISLAPFFRGEVMLSERIDSLRNSFFSTVIFSYRSLEEEFLEVKKSNKDLLEERQILLASFNKPVSDAKALREDESKLAGKVGSLLADLDKVNSDNKSLLKKVEILKLENKDLLLNNDEYKKNNASLLKEKFSLEIDNKSLLQKNHCAIDDFKRLSDEKKVLIDEINNYQKERKENRAKISRLENDVSKLILKIRKIEGDYHKVYFDRAKKDFLLSESVRDNNLILTRLRNAERLIGDFADGGRGKLHSLSISYLRSKYSENWYKFYIRRKQAFSRKSLIVNSGFFSPIYYVTAYPDVWLSGMSPIEHFYKYGWREGRNPSENFDVKFYLESNSDVARSGINPLIHYVLHGKAEGRKPLPVTKFDEGKYRKTADKRKNIEEGSVNFAKKNQKLIRDSKGNLKRRKDLGWEHRLSVIKILLEEGSSLSSLSDTIISRASAELSKEESLPLVSVVMPSWNRRHCIQDAISSVLGQRYQNWELIISDDGSEDGTVEFINENYKEQILSGHIKLIENEHKGVCATRNSGLGSAKGDLIAYLDSDNQWRDYYLLIMVSAFIQSDELNCAYSALQSFDRNKNEKRVRSDKYDRKRLLTSNFIDLNVFVHRSDLLGLHGGFDEKLTRLVDWEFIIRCTKYNQPAYLPFVGVDYYLDHDSLKNITTTVSLDDNKSKVYKKHFSERIKYGLDKLRMAYILWDFPALSQTFVMNELRYLVENGFDVNVYYSINPDKTAELDFSLKAFRVSSEQELNSLLVKHERNYCHSHFAYPAVTKLTWPVCEKIGIPFTFMPHAVDIFHYKNQQRNLIGEVSQSDFCKKIFVHGNYHQSFLEKKAVVTQKIAHNFQAVDLSSFKLEHAIAEKSENGCLTGVVLSRFVEKKGIEYLIKAAELLDPRRFRFKVYGYGPLEERYKQLIAKSDISNVELLGAASSLNDVKDVYRQSDFIVVPSVIAENGDRDGFPTVILEAFAVGLPVITTDVAAIPDYIDNGIHALVVPSADVDSLAEAIELLAQMPVEKIRLMTSKAQKLLHSRIGVEKSMNYLVDVWSDNIIDIFLVTYNTEGYNDREETLEIIRRIFYFTATPFVLTIIDNNSDDNFWEEVLLAVDGHENVRLIRKNTNLFCGPASNIALEVGESEFAIYICSKEGFIARKGWERTLIQAMRDNPNAALGGHLVHIPKYVYASEYAHYPEFSKFRNQDYLSICGDKKFRHIQGGAFIIRRGVYLEHGGFNPKIPHDGMDIELSYYYESLGYELLEIPEVASLTVKTLPKIHSIIDENTVIAHPLTTESALKQLDPVVNKSVVQCNICAWQGKSYDKKGQCPSCMSTSTGRVVYRYLSNNYYAFRNHKCISLLNDIGLDKHLIGMFDLVASELIENFDQFLGLVRQSHIILIDPVLFRKRFSSELISNIESILDVLSIGNLLVFFDDGQFDTMSCENKTQVFTFNSVVVGYDRRNLVVIEKSL